MILAKKANISTSKLELHAKIPNNEEEVQPANLENGFSDFVELRKRLISTLPNSEQGKAQEDYDEGAASLLATSAYLDRLLPKMDQTAVRLTQEQLEVLSRVRESLGEDFVNDFIERCDRIAEPASVMCSKLDELGHEYFMGSKKEASYDLHTLLEVMSSIYRDWHSAVLNGKFEKVTSKGLRAREHARNLGRLSRYEKKYPMESSHWGTSGSEYYYSNRQRMKAVLERSENGASVDKVRAPLEYAIKGMFIQMGELSGNALCNLRPVRDNKILLEMSAGPIGQMDFLTKNTARALFTSRRFDQQLGFFLEDGAYEVIDAEENSMTA